MAKCEVCGKGKQFGNNVSHSNKKTRRSWSPNIQKAKILVNGVTKNLKVCTRCLRNQYRSPVVA